MSCWELSFPLNILALCLLESLMPCWSVKLLDKLLLGMLNEFSVLTAVLHAITLEENVSLFKIWN